MEILNQIKDFIYYSVGLKTPISDEQMSLFLKSDQPCISFYEYLYFDYILKSRIHKMNNNLFMVFSIKFMKVSGLSFFKSINQHL